LSAKILKNAEVLGSKMVCHLEDKVQEKHESAIRKVEKTARTLMLGGAIFLKIYAVWLGAESSVGEALSKQYWETAKAYAKAAAPAASASYTLFFLASSLYVKDGVRYFIKKYKEKRKSD
jgi:hypothetical protein